MKHCARRTGKETSGNCEILAKGTVRKLVQDRMRFAPTTSRNKLSPCRGRGAPPLLVQAQRRGTGTGWGRHGRQRPCAGTAGHHFPVRSVPARDVWTPGPALGQRPCPPPSLLCLTGRGPRGLPCSVTLLCRVDLPSHQCLSGLPGATWKSECPGSVTFAGKQQAAHRWQLPPALATEARFHVAAAVPVTGSSQAGDT